MKEWQHFPIDRVDSAQKVYSVCTTLALPTFMVDDDLKKLSTLQLSPLTWQRAVSGTAVPVIGVLNQTVPEKVGAIALGLDLLFLKDTVELKLCSTGTEAIETGSILGASVGRQRAFAALLNGSISARQCAEWGLGEIIASDECTDPRAFVSRKFSGVSSDAVARLKALWNNMSSNSKDSTDIQLAQERIAFAKCFKDGAARRISRYLQQHIQQQISDSS